MGRIINADEYASMKPVAAARWLIGKFLVRRFDDGRVEARMITETEAYDGERDLACHARAGKTARTEPLYEAAGIWYVYLCYGIHEMLNLVVGPRDWPAAVLIRGLEGTLGPGRVTKLMGIDRGLNKSAASVESGLWLEDRDVHVPRRNLQATPRIGVDYAGEIWARKPWRFVVSAPAAASAKPSAAGRLAPRAAMPKVIARDRA